MKIKIPEITVKIQPFEIEIDPKEVLTQQALLPGPPAKDDEKPHRVITDKMIGYLRIRERWDEKMSFDEAHNLIGEIHKRENEEKKR